MGIGAVLCIWVAFIVVVLAIGRGFGDTLKRQPLDRVEERKNG